MNSLLKESKDTKFRKKLMRLQSCEGLAEQAGFELVLEGRTEFSQSGESREKDVLGERTV